MCGGREQPSSASAPGGASTALQQRTSHADSGALFGATVTSNQVNLAFLAMNVQGSLLLVLKDSNPRLALDSQAPVMAPNASDLSFLFLFMVKAQFESP